MPVLVLLILMDIVVLGFVMYVVKTEKPREHNASHPFVTEARQAEEKARLEAAAREKEAAEKVEEKADQP